MIFLDVKDYCQKCNHFEVDIEKPKSLYAGAVKVTIGDFVVRCQHRDICERMRIQFSHPDGEDLNDSTDS